jgi:Zn-dependent protease/predicted transcriptional regulator
MGDNVRLGRVAGFPVSVSWSVLVIVGLFTWSLASYSLPDAAPGHRPAAYWLAGFAGALLLLASLLAHELAHAVVARRAGIEVKGITLWLFGGVASLGGEARNPGVDFRIAAVGPATSLGLAAASAGIAAALDALGVAHILVSVVWWLAGTNLVLGLFNLIPGAPLDGGRILRAYLWRRHGDRTRAAVGAARVGQMVGYALIGVGVFQLFTGAGIGGLWTAFIGWFLLSAARAEQAGVTTRHLLQGVRVRDVMSTDVHTGPSWFTIDEFVQRYVLGDRHSAYPVQSFDGSVEGLVTLAQLRAVPPDARTGTRVRDVAIPLARVPTATPTEPLVELLQRLSPQSGGRALVFTDGRLVGIVTQADIAQAVELRALATPASPRMVTGTGHGDPV